MLQRFLAIGLVLASVPAITRADAFDNYFNTVLAKIPESKSAEKITKLTTAMMVRHNRALPGIVATFIVVKTNDGRFAKLLIQPARQKVSDTESVPIVLIERYVTFREGDERAIHARGANVRLFGDFRFSLDIGQVVPAGVPADVRVVGDKDECYLEPVGKAEIYLVAKHLPNVDPVKPAKLVIGAKFEPRYFNGAYKLFDDGRRSGTLHLEVSEKNEVAGNSVRHKTRQSRRGHLASSFHILFLFGMKAAVLVSDEPIGWCCRPF